MYFFSQCKLSVTDYLAVYSWTALQAKALRTITRNKQHAVFIHADHSLPDTLEQVS